MNYGYGAGKRVHRDSRIDTITIQAMVGLWNENTHTYSTYVQTKLTLALQISPF